jgi:hypothetical protein
MRYLEIIGRLIRDIFSMFHRQLHANSIPLEAYVHYPDNSIIGLSESQATAFMRSASESNMTEFGKHIPFSPVAGDRHITVEKAISEDSVREPGELDYWWGGGIKNGFVERKSCSKATDTATEPVGD